MKKKYEIVPLPDHQFQLLIDGQQRTRWHFDPKYPRPFFYPMLGASGESLTRMGHPGAPDHDHHRSVWFAHNKVFGQNFWADGTGTKVSQQDWIAIQDGDEQGRFGCHLSWLDGHDPTPLMKQQLLVEFKTVEFSSTDQTEWTLELQSTFTPTSDELELQQTNFGFLAVRVSRQIAEYWGGGLLTNSDGKTNERNIFGNPSRWMDYSGSQYSNRDQKEVAEGITFIDHPHNVGQPTRWHVREDGWMGASPGMKSDILLKKDSPLVLRYLLYVHSDAAHPENFNALYDQFAKTKPLQARRGTKKHTRNEIIRAT